MEGHLIVFLSLLAGTNTMEFTKVLVFPGIITVELRPCSMSLFVSCLDLAYTRSMSENESLPLEACCSLNEDIVDHLYHY